MFRRFTLVLCTVLLGAGCDSESITSGEGVAYRSEGTDYPNTAVALLGGDIVVGALVNGTIAPADGTIGYPAVIRFGPDGFDAVAFDDERDFYGVDGVATLGNGLAVAIGTEAGVEVYRTDRWGRGRERIALIEDTQFLPEDALHSIPGGLVLAVYPTMADGTHLYGLSASGDVRWTYRLPEAQDVRSVSVTADGDLFVAGSGVRGAGTVVARLSPDGAERWRREVPDGTVIDLEVTPSGIALATVRYTEGAARVDVMLLDTDGSTEWTRTLTAENRGGEVQVAGVGDAVVVGFSVDDGLYETGNEARLVVLDADGEVRDTLPIGDGPEATTFIEGLLHLPDGRLGLITAVGPPRLGGYGGDDFDIVVTRLRLDD